MFKEFNTPILFIIFNRLETTKAVFEEIKKLKPKQLFIAADGYREQVPDEILKCEAVKNYVLNNIDWVCEVKTLFRDKNLGCGKGPATAITWFFENVAEGIILEDDCLPDQSFFYFCEEMLSRYRDNDKVFMVSGDNFVPNNLNKVDDSYYFSNIPHIWGWATWRRAWNKFNFNINDLPKFIDDKVIDKVWKDKKIKKYWLDLFYKASKEDLDIWDYQWVYAIWKNNGLCIAPSNNLVSNIGFNSGGTHTLVNFNKLQNIVKSELTFPIKHPQDLVINDYMDSFVNNNIFLKGYTIKAILKKTGLLNFVKNIYSKIKK